MMMKTATNQTGRVLTDTKRGAALALSACLLAAGCGSDSEGGRKRTAFASLDLVCTETSAQSGSIFRDVRANARRGKTIRPRTVAVLKAAFKRTGYDLEDVRQHTDAVPRLIPASLPGDIKNIDQAEARKAIFIAAILPAVLQNNERILCERGYVSTLKRKRAAGDALSEREQARLEALRVRYGVKSSKDDKDDIAALLARIDIVPPSLTIAQAAIESGWGTSRFATDGNALFGQRTNNPDGGIRPAGHDADTKIRVRSFDRLTDSVAAYALNLNTHGAYRNFRAHRAALRRENTALAGTRLAATLVRYSERGPAYLRDLKLIIETNRLHMFDAARLKNATDFKDALKEKGESDA